MAFKLFEKNGGKNSRVIIRKGVGAYFSAGCYYHFDALRNNGLCTIYIDKENGLVGFKPHNNKDDKNSYPLKRYNKESTTVLTSRRIASFILGENGDSLRFIPQQKGDMIVIDLNDPIKS